MAKRKVNTQPFWRFLFVVYVALMLWLLFGRDYHWHQGLMYEQMLQKNISLKPLNTIRTYLSIVLHHPESSYFTHCLINLIGNVVMFVPAGWLLPRIFRRFQKFWRFFLSSILIILTVETVQLLTLLGIFDVDDIILNLLGMLIGFILWRFVKRK